jgi:hypothetical protein
MIIRCTRGMLVTKYGAVADVALKLQQPSTTSMRYYLQWQRMHRLDIPIKVCDIHQAHSHSPGTITPKHQNYPPTSSFIYSVSPFSNQSNIIQHSQSAQFLPADSQYDF